MLSESANKRLNLLKRAIKLYLARRDQSSVIFQESVDEWLTLLGLPFKIQETWTEFDGANSVIFITLTLSERSEELDYAYSLSIQWEFLIK